MAYNKSTDSRKSSDSDSDCDILLPLRGTNNKYLHPNMVENLPKRKKHKLRYVTPENYDRINLMHENGNGPLVPARINYPIQIWLLDGKDKALRTRDSTLMTSTDVKSIKGALLLILCNEKIQLPLDKFILCYRTINKKDKNKNKKPSNPKSIYDYNLSTVDFENIFDFVLREISGPAKDEDECKSDSYSKQGNKNKLLQKHQAVQKADAQLRHRLGPEAYKKLTSLPKVHVEVRWELGPGNKSWDEVKNKIFDAISSKEEEKRDTTTTTTTTTTAPQTLSTLNNINNTLQSLNTSMTSMATMLLNMQRSSYSATHSASTSVATTRYSPTQSIADPSLPPCVASLPNTILPNLPDLNKNNK